MFAVRYQLPRNSLADRFFGKLIAHTFLV